MNQSDESAQEASLELYKSQELDSLNKRMILEGTFTSNSFEPSNLQQKKKKKHQAQLSQVEQAIQVTRESPDLSQLRSDLQELIKLTEDGLLELKKAKLLQALDEQTGPDTSLEDEFAAFQASLSTEVTSPGVQRSPISKVQFQKTSSSSSLKKEENVESDDDENDENSEGDDNDEDDGSSYLSSLIGTKCRAPFSHEFGGHHYGNAMIWSVDPPTDTSDVNNYQVRVIFLNPVHPSIIPCTFYMDSQCHFTDQDCRRSHGHPVNVSELKPFHEPDHSKICEGCRCLAKFTDDVWYPGTIVDVCDDHQVNVKFDAHREESTVQVEHVLPLESESEESDSGDEQDATIGLQAEDRGEDDDTPVYLWKPSQTTDKMGAWEAHTKGIGSKLMAKMGYIVGQGLGPQGDGRAEPVPIMLLPQGKSLDKIMELKEMSGNKDMFDAMKKMEKRQKLMEKQEQEKVKRQEKKDNWGLFGFINNKLGSEKESTSTHHKHHPKLAQQSSDLNKKTDKEVNVQIFKTSEEMKSVERHLSHLRQQLARNISRDKKMADNVREKIREQEKYLGQLKTSSQTLETHRDRRSAHKKLSTF